MYPDKSANSSVEQVVARAHQELISLERERARIMERIGASSRQLPDWPTSLAKHCWAMNCWIWLTAGAGTQAPDSRAPAGRPWWSQVCPSPLSAFSKKSRVANPSC